MRKRPKLKKTKKKLKLKYSKDYIEKLVDWQKHQFDPGYYLGGNIHPMWSNTGREDVLGWFCVITSIIFALIVPFVLRKIYGDGQVFPTIALFTFFYSFLLIYFIAGVRLIKKSMSYEKFLHLRKYFLKMIIVITIVVTIVITIDVTLLRRENTIMIDQLDTIERKGRYETRYLYFTDSDLVLKCTQSQAFDVSVAQAFFLESSLKIHYRWKIYRPNVGRVITLERLD